MVDKYKVFKKHKEAFLFLANQLAQGNSKTTTQLAEAKKVSLGTVSEQLKIGRKIGIFSAKRKWKSVYHTLNEMEFVNIYQDLITREYERGQLEIKLIIRSYFEEIKLIATNQKITLKKE